MQRIRYTLTLTHGPSLWGFSEFDNQQVKPSILGMEVWAENPPSNDTGHLYPIAPFDGEKLQSRSG
ncbi:MAG TPA: hypothetical protein VLV18_06875, partial [Terriglobales bacterium]|nr:hypothetical protein [Terriglobales bacterium]